MNIQDFTEWFGFDPASYSIAIHLFTRLLGAIYVIAYIPFLFQIRGLIGKEGILPISLSLPYIKSRLGNRCYTQYPTLMWLNSSDTALYLLVWCGIVLGGLLMLGIYPAFVLLLLYLVHLSLTHAGQEFLGFGWETFLMEVTVALTLTLATEPYNLFGWIALNFLLLRFHIQAGVSKIFSQDKSWRNLSALSYHYFTQPLPNTTAWYFHKLPLWFHKLSALLMFYVELIVPLFIFSPPEIRLFVFTQLFGLQFFIWLTGNLSYLNHLTAVCCVILLHNRFLEPLLGHTFVSQTIEPSSLLWSGLITLLSLCFLGLQIINLWNTFFHHPKLYRILQWFFPYHISYPHGIFAVMTTKRYEIIIEGKGENEEWKEYHFFYKPGALDWRPRRIAPYQPRVDWQAWFLPFYSFSDRIWFQQFLIKLLQGSPPVLKLLKHNPFPDKPPLLVRALIYDYEFTSFEERAKTGNWWKRQLIGQYAAPVLLNERK